MKKKVLHVVGSLRLGGLETVAVNYFKHINRDEFEFHYLVYGNEVGELEKTVSELGGKIIKIEHPSSSHLKFYLNIKKVINNFGPYDIIHSHPLFNSGIIMRAAYSENIPKRITQSHSARGNQKNSILKKMYMVMMKRNIKKYSTDYTACSNEAGQYLFGKNFFDINGKVIKNGIDIKKFLYDKKVREDVREKLNLQDQYVIGHVGTLNKVKNQEFLIDILKLIIKKNKKTTLMLVGDGAEKESLIKKAKKENVYDHVLFVGQNMMIHDLLQAMDIFVFPSLYEGLGIALIEAQASGLPCIVSNAIPDEAIVSHDVEKVSLNEEVDNWVTIILEHKKKNKKRYNSYELIKRSGYSIENTINQIMKLYS